MILFNALVSETWPGMMLFHQLRWEKRREEGKAMGLETSLNISFFPPLKGVRWMHILWSLNEFAGK